MLGYVICLKIILQFKKVLLNLKMKFFPQRVKVMLYIMCQMSHSYSVIDVFEFNNIILLSRKTILSGNDLSP